MHKGSAFLQRILALWCANGKRKGIFLTASSWHRRPFAVALALATFALPPSNAAQAFSTSKEVAQSAKIDREILSEQDVVSDPLLNAWVQRITKRIWVNVRRTDVPYSAKVLDSSEVNAFTIGGGYIYLDEGVLDTVGSDDELAGVLGHETGHDEHRHPITLRQRGELLSIIFGLAMIVSPGLAALGEFGSEGYMAKTSRDDEYQADLEGLHFLVKAGYDPQAMISLMRRLQDLEGDADTHIDKYLADHPGLPQRIQRMQHQPEIVKRDTDYNLLLAAALRDQVNCRYAVAETRLAHLLHLRPQDTNVALHLAQVEATLGEPARAGQHFESAFSAADPAVRSMAQSGLTHLHQDERIRSGFAAPKVESLRRALLDVHSDIQAQAARATSVRNKARATLASVQERMDQVTSNAPALPSEGATEHLSHALDLLGRSLNTILGDASTVVGGIGSLDPGSKGGLWADSLSLNQQMAGALVNNDVPPDEWGVLSLYPQLNEQVEATNHDIVSSMDDAYQALLRLNRGINAVQDIFGSIERQERAGGGADPAVVLHGEIVRTQDAIAPALASAARAEQEYNRARSRQLALRLSLFNATAYPDRREALDAALNQRLTQASSPSEPTLQTLSAGEYSALRILSADAGVDPSRMVLEAHTKGISVIDLPEFSHVDTEALEIFMGLIYLDYTDDAATREFVATGGPR
jgi:predicted Zn-dependent protease